MPTILTKELIEEAKANVKDFPVEGFLVGQGSFSPKFMLIGEAPGAVEANETGIPFSGRAGKELDRFFQLLEVTREEVYLTSPFRSRPYVEKERINRKTGRLELRKYNRPPTSQELLAHAFLLDYEINKIQPPFILTMGNIGLQRLIGKKAKIGMLHGRLIESEIQQLSKIDMTKYQWTKEKYQIFPTFHPAAIFYNRKLEVEIQADLQKFKQLLKLNSH
ncbi:uracil-DNA glycosylase [Carnobacterium gallinarum]|uniref:uracil-DNA glycosylase n=1 Tax=Carnobacterium gallinarum TaxID=2749 RepID=UPI0005581339|nr:uracil-DNA glycosylase [Carnobacterium gallinarum]